MADEDGASALIRVTGALFLVPPFLDGALRLPDLLPKHLKLRDVSGSAATLVFERPQGHFYSVDHELLDAGLLILRCRDQPNLIFAFEPDVHGIRLEAFFGSTHRSL